MVLPGNSGEEQEDRTVESQEKIVRSSEIIRFLVKDGYLTDEQVAYAGKIHGRLDTPRRSVEIVKELGYVTDDQVKEALVNNRRHIRIGLLLLELGYITEKQLNMALYYQEQHEGKKRLGEILVEYRYISEYDLVQALSIHLGYPYVEVHLGMIDPSIIEKASKQYYLNNHFIPIGKQDKKIKIAMANPLSLDDANAAKQLFGPNLMFFYTMQSYINRTLEEYDEKLSHKSRIQDSNSRIIQIVDDIIQEALRAQASDIHMEPMKNRMRVRFRKDGALVHYTDIAKDLEAPVTNRIKILSQANITERRRHQDGRILMGKQDTGDEVDIRVSFYVTLFGEKIVMRLLTKKQELIKMSDLGMYPKMLERYYEEALDRPTGVIIITGPTGSGKTTTLYASINHCNNIDLNIITAEEPVEYVIEGIAQCSINPKIGLTFEETLRHILRQDPDIIMLGEIRDKFSAESAIQAALTGHKVLTTFHTEDSIGGLLRLMNMDIEAFLISSTVVSIVAQRLLRKVCPHCSEPYSPTSNDLRRLQYQYKDLGSSRFLIGRGCSHCHFTGYHGRTGVFELLILNEYVKDAILQRKTSYEIRRISIETTGLVTLMESGLASAARGLTSLQEVLKHLPNLESPRPFEQILRLTGDVQ